MLHVADATSSLHCCSDVVLTLAYPALQTGC